MQFRQTLSQISKRQFKISNGSAFQQSRFIYHVILVITRKKGHRTVTFLVTQKLFLFLVYHGDYNKSDDYYYSNNCGNGNPFNL